MAVVEELAYSMVHLYIGSRLQPVWLQQAPTYGQQISLH